MSVFDPVLVPGVSLLLFVVGFTIIELSSKPEDIRAMLIKQAREDPEFRDRLLEDPAATLEEALGRKPTAKEIKAYSIKPGEID